MWKYILIILFLFFAIREINLMDSSIHLTPDQKRVVVDDETLLSKLITLIKRKTSNTKEYEENIAKEYKIKKQEPTTQIQAEEETFSNLSLQKIETNQSVPTKPSTKPQVKQKDKISTQIPQQKHKQKIKKRSQPHEVKEVKLQTLETLEKKESDISKKNPNDLPKSFQNAQERVNAILREMKR